MLNSNELYSKFYLWDNGKLNLLANNSDYCFFNKGKVIIGDYEGQTFKLSTFENKTLRELFSTDYIANGYVINENFILIEVYNGAGWDLYLNNGKENDN